MASSAEAVANARKARLARDPMAAFRMRVPMSARLNRAAIPAASTGVQRRAHDTPRPSSAAIARPVRAANLAPRASASKPASSNHAENRTTDRMKRVAMRRAERPDRPTPGSTPRRADGLLSEDTQEHRNAHA
jgi:hypothetical protein